MKNRSQDFRHGRIPLAARRLALSWAFAASLAVVGVAFAQSDNFDDGNDTGWTRYDPIGSHPLLPDLATFSVVGGRYRIQSAPSPDPATVGPSRAGSLRRDVTYTDFYVEVDLVDWDDTLEQSVGILGRTTDLGLGSTDGYAMTYNFKGHDIDITRITDEDPDGGNLTVSGNDKVTLEKGRSYRLVFWGQGSQLGARVFDLSDLETPLADILGTDSTYASGICGLVVYDNSSGGSGRTDTTFDNYLATPVQPPKLLLEDLHFGAYQVSWPGAAADFRLEYTDTLPATVWTEISPDAYFYASETDRYRYEFDGSVGTRFFRLRR